MKNEWINYFSGSVQVKVTGKGMERFLNECVRQQIDIWNVRKLGTESITFFLHLKDTKKIRPIIRKSECKLIFLNRKGLPFLIRKSILNSGFLIGTILFFALIIILSNMVWGIEIKGAKPDTEHLVLKELKEMGIEKGKMQFTLDKVEDIQRTLTDNIDQITWVGVELKGTTFHFQVVEKNQPEPPEYFSPRHIVSKKKAVITDIFVEEGKPLVAINDFVNKGDLLVSGEIGQDGEKPEYVPARAQIFGETWYKSTVQVELSTKFNVFTGNHKSKHYLNIGSLSFPIWGFGKIEYKEYREENNQHSVRFFKWKLPISYEQVTIREEEAVVREYTEKEAVQVGKEIGKSHLEDKLEEDATIIGEKVLRQTTNNGKVKLEIYYNVIENIVTTIPLVQGD
ncbi:sporulation protein YqfD [Litchfieldia salsa]|uniref:Similar to stage IV sporulation protein n=1 Tax=Litchfieldia salsa TaxID=930152 RepID=A0A1H0V9T0_9BACI|nr:sporulation protein YqfD [Litchfieldia salsa]SDP75141.1 similar to stage IV sporulation protein [Litchfieldia salsa]